MYYKILDYFATWLLVERGAKNASEVLDLPGKRHLQRCEFDIKGVKIAIKKATSRPKLHFLGVKYGAKV